MRGLIIAPVLPFDLDKDRGFGDKFGLMAFDKAFVRQANAVWQADYAALSERTQQCWPLLFGIKQDVEGISLLVQKGYINQGYMVYRGLLEKIVTLLYLQIASDEVFKDYTGYTLHKGYRKTQTQVRIQTKTGAVGYRCLADFDLSKHPDVEAAVKRFTSASGKPHTRWSRTSIETKIAEIKQSGFVDTVLLELLISYVYDDASEALHGTLYGCVFHLNVFDSPKPETPRHLQNLMDERLFAALWLGAIVLFDVVEWLLGQTGQTALLEECREVDSLIKQDMAEAARKPRRNSAVDNSVQERENSTKPQD
jgi:hypothetical protein